jgi:hypothetical protein
LFSQNTENHNLLKSHNLIFGQPLRGAIEGPFFNPYSLVATAPCGDVIGFVFAELVQDFEGPGEPACLKLSYAGVTETYRRKRVISCLIEAVMLHRLPMFAAVLPDNQSNMAVILPRLGFTSGTYMYSPGFWWRP